MLKDRYDVVVIGAGPAGSVTARFAAENGASVLMLERDREPGIPVRCAEGVSHNGIVQFIDIDKRWIATTINVAKLQSPDGNVTYMYNNGVGYVVERRIFDTALCELACKYGAELITKADAVGLIREENKITGIEFRYMGKTRNVKCNIVIGADGVESRVGRWAGIDTAVKLEDIDTCVQYTMTDIDVKKDTCEFYFGNNVSPGGYVWIFPKSGDSANVGIGVSGHLSHKKGPKEYLDEFVERNFPGAKITYTVYGGKTTSATLKEIVKDNKLWVGIFIMPDNENKGMLENLCLETIISSPQKACIDEFTTCFSPHILPEEQENFKEPKARILSYLATRAPIVYSLGIAAKKGYWNFDHESLDKIKKFLTELFEDE